MPIFSKQITANISGGTGPFTFAWSFVSGDNTITIDNPGIHNPSFIKDDNYNFTGTTIWKLAVTDSLSQVKEQNVTIRFLPIDSLGLANSTEDPYRFLTTVPTVGSIPVDFSAAGGVGPYTYLWARDVTQGLYPDSQSGDDIPLNITTKSSINDVNSPTPTFSAPVADGDVFLEQWKVTVTDALGDTAEYQANLLFREYNELNVTVPSPNTTDSNSNTDAEFEFAKTVTATATGGIGIVEYNWACTSNGGVSVSGITDGITTSTLSIWFNVADGVPVSETWTCTVTDRAGNTDTVTHTFVLSHTQTAPQAGTLAMTYSEVDRDTNSGHVFEVWVDTTMGTPANDEWVTAFIVPNLIPGKTANEIDYNDKMVITIDAYTASDFAGPTNRLTLLDSNSVPITTSPGITTGTTQFFDVNDVAITNPILTTFTITAPRVSNEQV